MTTIELTKGYQTLVDDSDAEWINEHRWKATCTSASKVYAMRNAWVGNDKRIGLYLHRLIMQAPKGIEVDHIDGDSLNNQRSNLRLCSHAQNGKNLSVRKDSTSGVTGVYFSKKLNKWVAYINDSRRQKSMVYLGCFHTIEEAVDVRNSATVQLFGDFGKIAVVSR